MTTESGLQSRQQRQALFAQRRQIAANATKGLSSSQTAEAPGDLLLDFDHAQISLGEIIVKIHTQILQEGENRLLVFAQPIKQIAGSTLFASPPSTRRPNGMRMQPIAFIEQFQEAGLPIDHFQRVKPGLCLLTGLVAPSRVRTSFVYDGAGRQRRSRSLMSCLLMGSARIGSRSVTAISPHIWCVHRCLTQGIRSLR